MEFGEWVNDIRKERDFDLRSFAAITGVDGSTISRIENLHTQATLYTAFRICEGLGVSLPELIRTLNGKYPSSFEKEHHVEKETIVTLKNVEEFIEAFHHDEHNLRERLVKSLNKISSNIKVRNPKRGKLSFFTLEDIDKLLYSSSLYQFSLKYPTGIRPQDILAIYEQGGALMLTDVEVYVSKIQYVGNSLEEEDEEEDFENYSKASFNTLSRLAKNSVERIKLNEIMALDKRSKQDGKILGMFWEACKFHEKFSPTQHRQKYEMQQSLFDFDAPSPSPIREEWEYKLASVYIKICRWYQRLSDIDTTSWNKHLD